MKKFIWIVLGAWILPALVYAQYSLQKNAPGGTGVLSNGGFVVPSGQTIGVNGTLNGSGTFNFGSGTAILGAATATSINGLTITSSTGTFTLTNLKTFAVANSLTLSGTDGSTLNVGSGGTLGTGAFQPQTVIGGTGGQIVVSNGGVGATTLSLASALTGINSVTSASATDLTLTGNGGASLVLGNGATGNATLLGGGTQGSGTEGRVLLGAGPTADGYFQPLQWGHGAAYFLGGGFVTDVTPSYPAGVANNLGSIGYNLKNTPTSGDVQFDLGFESRYQNDPQGVDTEYYFTWNGPVGVSPESGGRSTRRPYQINTSWGTQYHAPSTRKMGYSEVGWDVNKFAVDNGNNFGGAFLLDFTASPNPLMTWQGAVTLSNGLTLGGGITQSGVNANSLTGATTLTAGNSIYSFATGNNALFTAGLSATGDTGLKFFRNGSGGTEYMTFGAAAGGTIFPSANSGYTLDMIGTSAGTAREFDVRYSGDSGSTYTIMQRTLPSSGTISFPLTTASTTTTSGAVTIGGGLGVVGSINAGNVTATGTLAANAGDSAAKIDATSTGSSGLLRIISNAIGNSRVLSFGYGATSTVLWRVGYNGGFPSDSFGILNGVAGGALVFTGNNNLLIGNTSTDMAGTYNLAVEGGVIDTRTTNPIVLKQNGTTALTIANSTLNAAFASTTEATTGGAGSLTTAGGIYAAKKIVTATDLIVGKTSATTPSALTYASPTSVDVTLANVFTVTTVNATGSVTFNATAGGTAGQRVVFIITNDATSAKTITFGTNFVANGTLTPSGASKVATIEFISNGTSLYELCRTILP